MKRFCVVTLLLILFIFQSKAQLETKLVAFGKNNHGQSGTNSTTNIQEPTLTQDIGDVKDFAIGASNVIAIAVKNGITSLWSWGSNSVGQLGVGSNISSSTVPLKVDFTSTSLEGKTPIEVSVGTSFVFVKASDNSLHAFGDNTYGQLGNGNTNGQFKPVSVNTSMLDGKTIVQIATGNIHSVILTDTLFTFGGNTDGQLGDGTNTSRSLPTANKLTGITSRVTMVSAGSHHTLFMTLDEKIYAFGSNTYGELGDGTTIPKSTYVEVITNGLLTGKTVLKLSSGFHYNLILASDQKVYSFGFNGYGQLGDGSTVNRHSLVAVSFTSQVTQIEAGYINSLLLSVNNQIHAFGSNDNYQLGLGSLSPIISSVPVAVSMNASLKTTTASKLSKLGSSSMMMAMAYDGVWSCEGLLNTNPSVCSSQGTCNQNGKCDCSDGFVGPNCQSIEAKNQLPLSPFTYIRGAIFDKNTCEKKNEIGTSIIVSDRCVKTNDGYQKFYCNSTHMITRFCYSDPFCFNGCTDKVEVMNQCKGWNVTDFNNVYVQFQCNNDPNLPEVGFFYDVHTLSPDHPGNCSDPALGKLVLDPFCTPNDDNTTSVKYHCVSGNRTRATYSTPNCTGTPVSQSQVAEWKTCSADGSVLQACNEVYDESHYLAMIPMGIIGTIFTMSPYILIVVSIVVILGIIAIIFLLKLKKGSGGGARPKISKKSDDSTNELQHVDIEAPPSPKRNTQKALPVAPAMPPSKVKEIDDEPIRSSIPVKMTIPDSFNTEWYYLDDEFEQHGPITIDELISAYKSKTVSNQTQVFGGEMEEWATISSQSQLQNLLMILD
eukprot:gene781-9031_t